MSPATTSIINAGAIMHHGVIDTPPQTSLDEVAAQMADNQVHCVVVDGLAQGADLQERLVWGIVSDLDLMQAVASGRLGLTAGEIAVSPVVAVSPEDSLGQVAQLMAEHESAHLVVVSPETGRPTGVISSLDVAGALARVAQGGR